MHFMMIFLISLSVQAAGCKNYSQLAEYLNTKKFIQASRDHRKLHGRELTIELADINQARSVAYRFPAFEELGFGAPGGAKWAPYPSRHPHSVFHGKNVGWEIHNEKGHARVRVDWDPDKGAHYNIEIHEKGKTDTHKMAISFKCGDKPCTQEQALKMVEKWQP